MYSYTATIGRNYSNTMPMPLAHWEQFVADVGEDMRATAETSNYGADMTLEVHRGMGVWQGVEEESAKITLLVEEPLTDDALNTLRHYLTENARFYDQDAIALTIGQSELV